MFKSFFYRSNQYVQPGKVRDNPLYTKAFEKGSFRDNEKRRKMQQKKLEEQDKKYKRRIERLVEKDQADTVLSKQQIHKTITQLVDTSDKLFIQKIKQENVFDDGLWQSVKQNMRNLPEQTCLDILDTVCKAKQQKYGVNKFHENEKFFDTMKNYFTQNVSNLNTSQIADLLYNYAYQNRYDQSFFKKLENELFLQEEDMIELQYVDKILYGFSFSDLGSSTIYKKIADSIKIGQHEIQPLQLAKYAKYYFKASDKIKGAYGIYNIAEKQIKLRMDAFEFNEIIKLCQYMITYNLGSNQFQQKVEENVLKHFTKDIKLSQLNKLVKAFSQHRFQDTSLLNKLQDHSINNLKYMSNQQLLETLWSFSRSKRGSNKLYKELESHIIHKMKMFNLRQLAFIMRGFSLVNHRSEELIDKVQSRFEYLIKEQEVNSHYLILIVMALNRFQMADSKFYQSILEMMNEQNHKLTSSQSIQLLYTVQKNEQPQSYQIQADMVQKFKEKIKKQLADLNIVELGQLLYSFVSVNCNDREFIEQIVKRIDDINQIPKTIFCDSFYSMVMLQEYEKSAEFIPIVKNLFNFGDVKYFFDHQSFIKLVWCSFIIQIYQQNRQDEDRLELQHLMNFKESILQINPNTLDVRTVKMWVEILSFIRVFIDIEEQELFGSLEQINPNVVEEMLVSQSHLENRDQCQNQLVRIQDIVQQKMQDKKYFMQIDFVDEFYNYLNLVVVVDQVKVGVIVLDQNKYLFRNKESEKYVIQLDLMIRVLKYIYNWKILIIDNQQLIQMDSEQLTSWVEHKLLGVGRKTKRTKKTFRK